MSISQIFLFVNWIAKLFMIQVLQMSSLFLKDSYISFLLIIINNIILFFQNITFQIMKYQIQVILKKFITKIITHKKYIYIKTNPFFPKTNIFKYIFSLCNCYFFFLPRKKKQLFQLLIRQGRQANLGLIRDIISGDMELRLNPIIKTAKRAFFGMKKQ